MFLVRFRNIVYPKGPTLPETGDDASMAAMALGGILAAAGLGLAGKRKKED